MGFEKIPYLKGEKIIPEQVISELVQALIPYADRVNARGQDLEYLVGEMNGKSACAIIHRLPLAYRE